MSESAPTLISEYEADVEVSAVQTVAEDVVELTLTSKTGSDLPQWTPGAHIDLILSDDLTRQYSLCSSPSNTDAYKVSVLKAPDSRGGSTAVHALKAGDTIRIRGPRNNFQLVAAKKYIFIAGGIGITPMLPMIEAAIAGGADWQLHYGGRTKASMAYLKELSEHGDRVHIIPQDELGIPDIPGILAKPDADTLVYVCGPEPLLQAVEKGCESWPAGALHLERFAAKEISRDGEDTEFEVVLQRSGRTITVGANQSVFDAMRAADVSVLGSCLEGICGTCETGVLDGEVDHRDSILDEDERAANDAMMVCVSRAKSKQLTLDA